MKKVEIISQISDIVDTMKWVIINQEDGDYVAEKMETLNWSIANSHYLVQPLIELSDFLSEMNEEQLDALITYLHIREEELLQNPIPSYTEEKAEQLFKYVKDVVGEDNVNEFQEIINNILSYE